MTTVLHVDASPRGARSHSRQLARAFVDLWQTQHPEAAILYRDLNETPVPHVTETWIAADFAPPKAHTPEMAEMIKFSDTLVDELLAADAYLFSVPMYNFSIPSNFKAYIDQIVRVGRTFAIEDNQFKGLVNDKKALFITTRGARYDATSPFSTWDYQTPALRAAFQFIGITQIEFIHAEGLDLGDESQAQGISQAKTEIEKLAAVW